MKKTGKNKSTKAAAITSAVLAALLSLTISSLYSISLGHKRNSGNAGVANTEKVEKEKLLSKYTGKGWKCQKPVLR